MTRARLPFHTAMARTVSSLAVLAVASSSAGCKRRDRDTAALHDGELVQVLSIIKGDEIAVATSAGEARVRMLGVQAFSAVVTDPQVQALSAGSVAALKDLIGPARVKLVFDTPTQDVAGRYLAYLENDGVDINRKLVEDGWAVVYTEYPFARERAYFHAERQARVQQRNIWVLAPAANAVLGLRKQWAAARAAAGRAAVADPLLP